jgi:hypothetical protein
MAAFPDFLRRTNDDIDESHWAALMNGGAP